MKYEYWFANIQKLNCKRKLKIRQVIKTAEELYYIEETELKQYIEDESERALILNSASAWNVEKEYQKMVEKGVWFVTMMQENYPNCLRQIPSPPYALFVKGSLPDENKRTIAIVGARECTPYGEVMAEEFAGTLARHGVQIVSGMARGVDGAGQLGALEQGGSSFGVLGCGVDVCYPREQIELYMKLQEQGGIISEFPIGTNPLPQHFPARNRIISGFADTVLVIEAKEKSGSLITADMALEQGKDVYALPGPINSQLSMGCNRLIRQGAGILLEPEELLVELGICHEKEKKKESQIKILLETTEELVYSCLGLQPKNLESLYKMTKIESSQLLGVLMRLQLKGVVREVSKNYYVRVK